MNESLRMRLGAVILALLTVAAVIFAVLNLQQRSRFVVPDDGITWMDSPQGVGASHVVADSPGSRAGIKQGDYVQAVRSVVIHRATDVARVLWRVGPWAEVRYGIRRNGESFETPVVTAPQETSPSIENYLRVAGLLYLFIGLFIFVRRWSAPRAIHFYVFCLVSFILYSFHYSGKLDTFDLEVYWSSVVARLLAPALLLHFALVFPERTESARKSLLKFSAVYAPAFALLLVHVLVAINALGFVPTTRSRVALDQLELGCLGAYFLAAGITFYLSYRRIRSGVLRQQLKWLTGGT